MTQEQASIIYKDVIQHFGYTSDPVSIDATYLLQNGHFLDTCGGAPNHQHINVANYISQKYGIDDINMLNDGSKFMINTARAVKITCWNSGKGLKGIYIPKKELKEAQYIALKSFIGAIAKYVTEEWPLWIATYDDKQQIEYKKRYGLAERAIEDIKYYYISGNLELTEGLVLHEDTRTTLIAKSRNAGQYKNQTRGKNRFERKKWSHIANTVKHYNQIDMNSFFKEDQLIVHIPVIGETDTYNVTIKMDGVVTEIAKNIKNNKNQLEYRTIVQALTKVFNTANVYVKCSCPDFRYTFAHRDIINKVSVDDSAADPGPGKGIRNPNDMDGRGCKHILLVLANGNWIMKVASVINNYIHYAEENLQKPFLKVIFPKLYGILADEMVEKDLVDDDKYLDSSKGLIDAINEYGRKRGQYRPGSNKNPVNGKGGRAKKEEEQEEKL